MITENLDVLVVGAGLSGIGAGYRLQTECTDQSYAIVEARDAIGGTWDLFRYPGIRSDSDMFTLGYPFRPWTQAKSIADGASILRYIKDTAKELGIDRRIRFNHRVISLNWSSDTARWNVEIDVAGEGRKVIAARFVYMCSGYYSYESGHKPEFPGSASFQGRIIHPQEWPADLDYAGKKVVIIGSGATAVTLVPAMSDTAAHVTMLQRSPSYITPLPDKDPIADALRERLPADVAHNLVRWKNVLMGLGFYQFCRRFPEQAKWLLRQGVIKAMRGEEQVDPHFKPTYQPWDQRMCLVPNADLFKALRSGKASVVTDHIETFTEKGIRLVSGQELEADVIVAATGLKLQVCGGATIGVDGRAVKMGDAFVYKGLMLSGVPNMAMCLGYTNASWTLRADLSSRYVCRLLNHMKEHDYAVAMPELDGHAMEQRPILGLQSGYVTRAAKDLPKQGNIAPWYLRQNYILDLLSTKFSDIEDSIRFSRAPSASTSKGKVAFSAAE